MNGIDATNASATTPCVHHVAKCALDASCGVIPSRAKPRPTLYLEPPEESDPDAFALALKRALREVQQNYPGVDIKRDGTRWEVIVPARYHVGHEAHFGQVTDQFLGYVKGGSLPDWEVPNMLAKYYTTTTALARAETSPSSAA